MKNGKSMIMEIQLDTSSVQDGVGEAAAILTGLQQIASRVGSTIAQALSPIATSLQSVQESFATLPDALSSITEKLSEITTMMRETQGGGLLASLFGGVETIGKLESVGEQVNGVFKDFNKYGENFSLFKSVFPEITAMVGNIGTALTEATKNVGGLPGIISGIGAAFGKIGTAFSGMSLGWGAAIAGIITLIVLLVTNWDTVKAAILTAWEAIKSALGTAAEWLNTTIIQPVVGFLTGLWTGIVEIATGIWDGVVGIFSAAAQWVYDTVLKPILDFFAPIVEWYAQLFGSIWKTVSDVFYNIGVSISGCWEIIKAVWAIVGSWFNDNVIQPVVGFFTGLWTSISTFAVQAWESIKGAFSAVGNWFYQNVIQPVAGFFSGLWSGFLNAASAAWDGVKGVFSVVGKFFGDIFSKAWQGVVKVFSAAGSIFVDIKDAIVGVFKTVVNGIIKGLNSVIAVPFNGINSALKLVKNIEILGLQPFSGLKTISVPQIPLLAQGAVLSADRISFLRKRLLCLTNLTPCARILWRTREYS